MKVSGNIFKVLIFTLLTLVSARISAQISASDKVVADSILRAMPEADNGAVVASMTRLSSLGEEAMGYICSLIIPAGSGDDTAARYAVSSMTSFLSGYGDPDLMSLWERVCLRFTVEATDREVRSFFIRQLGICGSDMTVSAMSPFLNDSLVCSDVVMTLQSIGSDSALSLLAEALSSDSCRCPSQIMGALAFAGYRSGLESYRKWFDRGDAGCRRAALNAIAVTGDKEAEAILTGAAAEAGFSPEATGAVASLLRYAKKRGVSGDIRSMKRITGLVIDNSTTHATASQRINALGVITEVMGSDALPGLIEAADDPDPVIRAGALRLSASVSGEEATRKWVGAYSRMRPDAKADLLFMLGRRGDAVALPLLEKAMNDPLPAISGEAVQALARIQGRKAAAPLVNWIISYETEEGHRAAADALITILDSSNISLVAAGLKKSHGLSSVTLLRLLAWSGDRQYFDLAASYVKSPDPGVRAAALTSLASLSSYDDQEELIGFLLTSESRAEINVLQKAITSAAMQSPDPGLRAAVIIRALDKGGNPIVLIPLLAVTGDSLALRRVIKEFDNGDAIMRDACFDALIHWHDHSALGALAEIAASGNKTFGRPAFDAYLRMLWQSPLTAENKYLLVEKIAPAAIAPDARVEMIQMANDLNIIPSLLFIRKYLTDPVEEVRMVAEELTGSAGDSVTAGFVNIFDGADLEGWTGDTESYLAEDGMLVIRPGSHGTGNLYTVKEYSDFVFTFEFMLTPGANNGLGIRAPLKGDAAYTGMEIQILDDYAPEYSHLQPYQYHGSVYGVVPAKRGYLNPAGQWNVEEVTVSGTEITVKLNGTVITRADISKPATEGTMDGKDHPGLKNKTGHIGFLGHGSVVKFRNIWIKKL